MIRFQRSVFATVTISALGYFVDIYDLILFSIVRKKSLIGLGILETDGTALLNNGVYLLNMQMTGMLIGGLIWGILGDKKGRVSVLFGSILLYSLANIGNAFVTSVPQYGILRLLAGIGLAGELGAAITLVSEVLSKENRGYGTTIVASVGLCGAVVAAMVGDRLTWQTAYIIGGVMGLALLVMRISMMESGMFKSIRTQTVMRGDFLMLFKNGERFKKYISCISIGIPIWYVIGILVTFSPEISVALGTEGAVQAGFAVMYAYIGLAIGDLASGLLSQLVRSRKKIVLLFLLITAAFVIINLRSRGVSVEFYYFICGLLGFGAGYWAVFVTIASEHFGTNLRATVTTTTPNFVRGSVVPMTYLFKTLIVSQGILGSAMIVGAISLGISFVALRGLNETFGKHLDYVE